MRIGYYVHHHGAGHRTRAEVISAELRNRGHRVTRFGTGLTHVGPHDLPLPPDTDEPTGGWRDPTAGGALHWAPLQHPGHRERLAMLSTWITESGPDAIVVDVSIEVTMLVRLMGIPTVVVGQPGDRTDLVHQTGYRLATAIVAPWPAAATPCPGLGHHEVTFVGGISRFRPADRLRADGPALLLSGAEGLTEPNLIETLRTRLPDHEWLELGGASWRSDPDDLLRRAPLVVGHAGQNCVADAAALGLPLIVVPQPRPFAEQHHMAAELNRLEVAALAPANQDWRTAAQLAHSRAGNWNRWQTVGAAARAADLIEHVAGGGGG